MTPANGGPTGALPTGLRIVLVEDSPFDARYVTELVQIASAGAQILRFARMDDAATHPACVDADCILLDLGLPDVEGLEAVEHMVGVAGATPIVVLTGRDDERLALEAVRAGAQDYLIKRELDSTTLTRTVGRAIERARFVRKLASDALHDELTGLPERVLFNDRLAQAIARSRRTGTSFSLAFIDVDGFKAVNDRYGHAIGDAVLRTIASRLAGALRASDTASRFGGDEFAAVCEHASSPQAAALVAARMHDAIASQPVPTRLGGLRVSVSIGVASGSGSETADELLRRADQAMYRAKSTQAGFALYEPAVAGALPLR